jgi:ribose transport system substrate-binding protein
MLLPAIIVVTSAVYSSPPSSGAAQSSGGLSAAGAAGLARARSTLALYEREPKSIGITTPVGKSIPGNKNIDAVFAANGSANLDSGPLTAAGSALGWNVKVYETQFTPQAIQSNFAQAVSNKPAGFAYAGFQSSVISQYLNSFAASKTPVTAQAVANVTNPAKRFVVLPSPNVYALDGKMLAASITAATGGKGKLLMVTVPAFQIYSYVVSSVKSNLRKYCPGCSVAVYNIPAASIGTNATSLITSYIQGHPGINGLVDVFGSFSIGLPTALNGAGINPATVKIVALYSPTQVIGMVKQGQVFAVIPFPFDEYGWTAIDVMARMMLGQSIAPDITTTAALAPAVIWTQKNAPANTNTTDPIPIIPDYQSQFLTLWGKK